MRIQSFGLPAVLFCFAIWTGLMTDFNSVIGLLFCTAAIFASSERTISNYNEKNGIFFILGIFFIFISVSSFGAYYTMMTWD